MRPSTHSFIPGLVTRLVALLLLAPFDGQAAPKASAAKRDATEFLFTGNAIPRIQIEIPEEALAILRKYQWQFGQTTEREAVQVTVREGQNVYTNVALHLKGAAGSFRGIEQNPAMTFNFDKFAPKQSFHGLTKLSLNNSVQDPTLISEQICRELFLQAGVPVPRASHALVELNGRDLGLYVLTEGWDKAFLKRHFKKTTGNLYDGGFIKEVSDELSTNAGENPKDQADRIALTAAAKETNLTTRLDRLGKVLDLDRFLTFVAMDVLLWNWDGYALNRNNWRLYHDMDKDKFVFMPHGLDQMFWKPEASVLPAMEGLVAKSVLEIPGMRARYLERMKELRRTVFKPEVVTNRVHQIGSKFASVLLEKYPDVAREQQRTMMDFCEAIMSRGRNVEDQLARPIQPIEFDSSGLARLAAWESKTDFGFPVFQRTPGPAGTEFLTLRTEKGSSIGSWRSKFWIEKGRYKIEGRVKTEGIVPDPGDPRGGAGFRLIKNRPEKYVTGDSDWRELSQEFSINDPLSEIQIACEFRGAEGQALFDLQSLRLRRVPADKEPNAKP